MGKAKKFNDLTSHIILFSKGHYGRPENVSAYERLVDFMWRYSWTPKEYFTPKEIYKIVADSFVEACDKRKLRQFIIGTVYPIELYYLKSTLTIEDLISSMIGLISSIQVKNHDKRGRLYSIISLPKIKQEYVWGSPLPKALQNYG